MVLLVLHSSHVLAAHIPMQGAGLAVPAPDYPHPIFLLVCIFLSPDKKISGFAGKTLHYHSSGVQCPGQPPGQGECSVTLIVLLQKFDAQKSPPVLFLDFVACQIPGAPGLGTWHELLDSSVTWR